MVQALLREMRERHDYTGGEIIETVYLGGGTPSLLSEEELNRILDEIRIQFPVAEQAEFTLEANPDDINSAVLQAWKNAGINRLSIGVQSFFEEDLQWMNRAHNARQASEQLEQALQVFENITIDLIYGSPGLTDEKWKQNVERALALGIPHLSCYALTVEPRTPLDKQIRLQQTADVDPDLQSGQFLQLMEWTGAAGYEHYEISNFAKPGWRSRHNSAYWSGATYLGIGPSAHSFNGRERQWNISNNSQYIRFQESGEPYFEKEILTPVQQLNEYIMTALRTSEGIHLPLLEKRHGITEAHILQKAKSFVQSGHLLKEGDALLLTREGKLLADGIAARLFFDENGE